MKGNKERKIKTRKKIKISRRKKETKKNAEYIESKIETMKKIKEKRSK